MKMAKFNLKVKKDLTKIVKKSNNNFIHASADIELYKKDVKKK